MSVRAVGKYQRYRRDLSNPSCLKLLGDLPLELMSAGIMRKSSSAVPRSKFLWGIHSSPLQKKASHECLDAAVSTDGIKL